MSYKRMIRSIFAIFILGCFCVLTAFGQSQMTYQSTLRLLNEMRDVLINRDKLAKLFRVGDERISDLVKALDDPNPDISFRAQIVIRYLGNENGMKGLFEWYSKQGKFRVAGPVPIPLRERDYKVICTQYIDEPPENWVRSESYIYALALDSSPKAKEVLKKLIRIAGNLAEATVANRAIRQVQANQPAKILIGEQDLAELVLSNAFFVSSNDRKYASARLLTLNGARDKALIEVHINRGALSEEWYHVVIKKCGQNWCFLSITLIAIS